MRVRIIFELKNRGASVPFHHQFILSQFIKGVVMKGGDPRFQNFDLYNFSGLKGQTRVSRDGLEFTSSLVTLVFSCPSKLFVDYFLSLLFDYPQIELGNLKLIPSSVELEDKIKFEPESKFICISPVVLTKPDLDDEKNKRFVHPQNASFSQMLHFSTIERMRASKAYPEEKLDQYSAFELTADDSYIKRMNDSNKKYARIYPVYYKDIRFEVRGYTLPFTLRTSPEVQNFIFTCGIGSLTHMGFGMLDLVKRPADHTFSRYETFRTVEE